MLALNWRDIAPLPTETRHTENARIELERHRSTANRNKAYREFSRGDKVLILLPKDGNNLFMTYQGPYHILAPRGNNNYLCQVGNAQKTYHANLLKKYVERIPQPPHHEIATANLSFVTTEDMSPEESALEHVVVEQTESHRDVIINPDLNEEQKADAVNIVSSFDKVSTDVPGRTNATEHTIRLVDNTPFRMKQYPIPFHSREAVAKEIEEMLKTGVIRHSDSPYASPITVVKKKDGKIRLCIDFRKLNSITIFDAEPIPTLDELLVKIEGAKYFTKIDLTKGYWQIPLAEKSKAYTAFRSPMGLMEFNFMPFGLSTAAPSLQRAMQEVLGRLPFIVSYFDDIMVYSNTWLDHLNHLQMALQTIQDAGLTARPKKSLVGFTSIEFLGHIVSRGIIQPDDAKKSKIKNIIPPATKKEVQRICGLLNYYRRFIPHFSELARPLTDMTRCRGKIVWTAECQKSLDTLKTLLTSEPILRIPDLSKPFVVQADASQFSIGAVLMQQHDGILLPCYYASRKLLDREVQYAIIEKECLAIVFALHTFAKYLLMRPFYIQTDHKPLTFLVQNKSRNSRLLRWALSLQQFAFHIQPIPGAQNVISDALSRIH